MDSQKVYEPILVYIQTYLVAEQERYEVYEKLADEGRLDLIKALLSSRALTEQGLVALIEQLTSR